MGDGFRFTHLDRFPDIGDLDLEVEGDLAVVVNRGSTSIWMPMSRYWNEVIGVTMPPMPPDASGC